MQTGQVEYTAQVMPRDTRTGMIFADKLEASAVNIKDIIRFLPEISIISPDSGYLTGLNRIPVAFNMKDKGDPIANVRVYVNDKLVSQDIGSLTIHGDKASCEVSLVPGRNTIRAVVISGKGYQSNPSEIGVTCTGSAAASRFFLISIGNDRYKNPAYNLNYAVADATAFTSQISRIVGNMFKSTQIFTYCDENARHDSIAAGFRKIAFMAQPQDVFILFYAGHGVMSEGSPDVPKDFYLALNRVTHLYGRDDQLQSEGISAAELRELCRLIPAQKQVVFLDACQSGAAIVLTLI